MLSEPRAAFSAIHRECNNGGCQSGPQSQTPVAQRGHRHRSRAATLHARPASAGRRFRRAGFRCIIVAAGPSGARLAIETDGRAFQLSSAGKRVRRRRSLCVRVVSRERDRAVDSPADPCERTAAVFSASARP